jgi:hypothetical protein
MRSHLFLALSLAAAAATTALVNARPQANPPPSYTPPANISLSPPPPPPPLSNAEFGLVMQIPGPNVTYAALVATYDPTYQQLVLVAQRLSAYTGTPAYISNPEPQGSQPFDWVSLNLDVNGTSYGLSAAYIIYAAGSRGRLPRSFLGSPRL